MRDRFFISPSDVGEFSGVIVDCRFALDNPDAGQQAYLAGHIPGAIYLDLERDLSGPKAEHGGRHPLPDPAALAADLARRGIGLDTPTLIYDDSGYPFAARLWWMLRALGYASPRLLDGGFSAWARAGGVAVSDPAAVTAVAVPTVPEAWPGAVDRDGLKALQGQGAELVDAREAGRYLGEHEPIDPIAGHIPGAVNRPWQSMLDEDKRLLPQAQLRSLWGDLIDAQPLVAYCGSGVSACVDLLALATLGREDALLYSGSWSDWCSYL